MKHVRNIIVVIGSMLVVGIAFVMVGNLIDANRAKAQFPIKEQCIDFEDALVLYKSIHGFYPPVTNGLEIILNEEGCKALLKNTNLIDPWGTPFKYELGEVYPNVYSAGPDKKFGTPDDIHSMHGHN